MNAEQERLKQDGWKKWGPYVSDRQWGTVREDYSAHGDAWHFTTHDMARSRAWRWGEDAIAGISDKEQFLCFGLSLWNGQDSILKERMFGLASYEGNHGEDVKELYYYLDNTPTHSYMKMLYKYPQHAFPYEWLVEENKRRTRQDPEFELADTGIFTNNEYFDVFVEYAKADTDDILIRITVHNRAQHDAAIHVLPTVWFRNTWDWGNGAMGDNTIPRPIMYASGNEFIAIHHSLLGSYKLYCADNHQLLFCENETNTVRLFGDQNPACKYFKDGINDYIVHGKPTINPDRSGTKATAHFNVSIPAGQSHVFKLRLSSDEHANPAADYDQIFAQRQKEADDFYKELQDGVETADQKMVQRQAFAGMLWNKQFYYYDVAMWLKGDPSQPPPPAERLKGRNHTWKHLNNEDIISMPDKWEYPWYAAWDLAFHCVVFSLLDPAFAKKQLITLTHEWYMHPNGQLPAYEWSFSDTNPPVHAWAAMRVFELDRQYNNHSGDTAFLETIFHKLLINFTWWVNRKDEEGNNVFEGGFLGMDNISLFDRSNMQMPEGGRIEQADGTSWMAMYSLNMMRMALELAKTNPVYQDMATKFFEHFLFIAEAMSSIGQNAIGLWDEEDEFFYDVMRLPDQSNVRLKVRSMVGLIPLFAVEVIDDEILKSQPVFAKRLRWFLDNRPELAALVSHWHEKGAEEKHLLSLLRGHRIKRILYRMLDENEFLSPHGVRSLSKYHLDHPFSLPYDGTVMSVQYAPAESPIPLFGGNSNWRGPVWMPVNFLIIESLQRFHHYYNDDFKVEYPTGSNRYFTLDEIAVALGERLESIFLRNEQGIRPAFGEDIQFQSDPLFRDYLIFSEYFHGDTGKGLGASHQTGWTGLIAKLLQPRKPPATETGGQKNNTD